jgi:hypothetical protein
LIFVLFAGTAFPAPAAQRPSANSDARAVADFYRGKVVRIFVGFPPGGGCGRRLECDSDDRLESL